MSPTLSTVVSQHPYPEYQDWWPLGESFLAMMADAIVGRWRDLSSPAETVDSVQNIVDEYIARAYHRQARPRLAAGFRLGNGLSTQFSQASSTPFPLHSSCRLTANLLPISAATNWVVPAGNSRKR